MKFGGQKDQIHIVFHGPVEKNTSFKTVNEEGNRGQNRAKEEFLLNVGSALESLFFFFWNGTYRDTSGTQCSEEIEGETDDTDSET